MQIYLLGINLDAHKRKLPLSLYKSSVQTICILYDVLFKQLRRIQM